MPRAGERAGGTTNGGDTGREPDVAAVGSIGRGQYQPADSEWSQAPHGVP